jgi:hypothetical protein
MHPTDTKINTADYVSKEPAAPQNAASPTTDRQLPRAGDQIAICKEGNTTSCTHSNDNYNFAFKVGEYDSMSLKHLGKFYVSSEGVRFET